ncbi:hypothetical protein TNCV_4121411 [Trichonephila clavipes]|nr:hypothetical protein TNCV_4121411 [Trichonephila clavipes]
MWPLEDADKNGCYNGRFQCHDGSGRPRATADREDRLIVRSAVAVPDSSLSTIRRVTHDVWRRPGNRADDAVTNARYTAPEPGVMAWGANSFENRAPLVVIQQDNARPHTARVAMNCLQLVKYFLGQPDSLISLQSSMSWM